MKPARSLALAASLVASALPAQAQPRYVQLQPNVSNWSHVRAIAPGSKVIVSAVGLGGRNGQYFLSATDRSLTLLIPDDADLPRPAKRFVIELAETHPDIFTSPQRWAEYRDGRVRVNPDGVFLRARKVAGLDEIAKTIDAGEVAEVAKRVRAQRRSHDSGAPPAEGVAALVPFLGLSFLGCHNECGRAAITIAAIGAPIIAAEILAARRAGYTTEVVYRAR
jgi:hypothetical protein